MEKRWYFPLSVFLLLTATNFFFRAPVQAAQLPNEGDSVSADESALSATTGDAALEGQITKISREIEKINLQMAHLKKTLRETTDEAQKTASSSELDRLRGERRALQQLLDKLVEAGKADEGTAIDQALQRARKLERMQERASEQQETIYDRRTR